MNRWVIIAVIVLVIGSIYVSFRTWRVSVQRKADGFQFFTFSEFDSPDAPGSGEAHMKREFIHKLDKVREAVGLPFIIDSGYRTPAHNAEVGGATGSSHMSGYAADIVAPTDAIKRKIAKAAIAEGITRIGWGNSFIHLDMDPSKDQRITWGYGNGQPPTFSQLAT